MVKISKNLGAWVKIAKIDQNSRQVGMFTLSNRGSVFFPNFVSNPKC